MTASYLVASDGANGFPGRRHGRPVMTKGTRRRCPAGPVGGYSARIMVSRPTARLLTAARTAGEPVSAFVRRQFITRNRRLSALLAACVVAIGLVDVHVSAWWVSPGVVILPILAGGLLLRVRALRILFGVVTLMIAYSVLAGRAGPGIVATIAIVAVLADALARSREKLGVRGLRGEQMLVELRDRLRVQGRLAALPEGWGSRVVLEPADGSSFGGDFVVSTSDSKTLELALVDVSGRGIDAGTRALLLSGAFGGLLGSVPTEEFLGACNAYLRRGRTAEGFVRATRCCSTPTAWSRRRHGTSMPASLACSQRPTGWLRRGSSGVQPSWFAR